MEIREIYEVLGPLHYLVELDDGRVQKRHIDQIRKISHNVPKITQHESKPQYTDAVIINDDSQRTSVTENMRPITPEKIVITPKTNPMPRRSTRTRRAPERLNYA